MIDRLKPYPKYKDSGVPWLGEVPEHWEVRSLGSITSLRSVRGRPDLPLLSVVREKGVIPRASMSDNENHNFIPDDLRNYKVAHAGDLVINKMKAWQGSLGIAPIDGIVSPAYFVMSLDITHLNFAHLLLRSRTYIDFFARASDGVRIGQWDLSPEQTKRIPVAIPPDNEQAMIARFLAHAQRRISRYIHAKKKLIALLNEQKQAIIHRAVTYGDTPGVERHATGNRFFSEIPRHWKLLAMRRLIRRAVDGPHHSPAYLDSGVPFLSARNIRADRWLLDDVKYISRSDYEEFCKRVRPERGDVLYTKGGTTGIAKVVDLAEPFQVWVHVAVLKLKHTEIDASYLAMALNSPRCYEQSQLFTRGATNQDLGLGRMKDIVLPVPPIHEQCRIVDYVMNATRLLDQLVSHAEGQIALARELRTCLSADVITGKRDVREAAAHLPLDEAADEFAEIGDTDEALVDDDEAENEAAEVED